MRDTADRSTTIPPRRAARRRWLKVTVLSLLVTITFVPILAWYLIPHIHRWHMLEQLVSDQPAQQDRALRYVLNHANRDPRILQGTLDRLHRTEDDAFLKLVVTLDQLGRWSTPPVSIDQWVRWLSLLQEDTQPGPRLFAALQLPHLPIDLPAPQQEQVARLTQALLADPEPLVRQQMVYTTVQRLKQARDRLPLVDELMTLAEDDEPEVARDAWLYLGMLMREDPSLGGFQAHWKQAAPEVAQAILWVATWTNPDRPQPALAAAQDPDVHPRVRATALWLLATLTDSQPGHALLADLLTPGPEAITADNIDRVWVAARFIPIDPDNLNHPGSAALIKFLAQATPDDLNHPLRRWPILAAIYRQPAFLLEPAILTAPQSIVVGLQHPLGRLAAIEGHADDRVRFPSEMADYTRIASAAIARDLVPNHLEPAIRSHIAPFRDLACLVALERLSPEAQLQLATALLRDYDDQAIKAGAMLAGLAGLKPTVNIEGHTHDLLELREDRMRHQSQWHTQQIIRLALWLQNRHEPFNDRIDGLLTRDDLPMTTLLLAMLHKGDRKALDYLLAPFEPERRLSRQALDPQHTPMPWHRGNPLPPSKATATENDNDTNNDTAPPAPSPQPVPPALDAQVDLLQLFSQYRWWLVLDRYLPDDAPRMSLWADQWLQQFQIDLLRRWYELNREDVLPRHHPRLQVVPSSNPE